MINARYPLFNLYIIGDFVVVYSWFVFAPIVCVRFVFGPFIAVWFLVSFLVLLAIILLRKRELVAWLNCVVAVCFLCLFLTVPRVRYGIS